jgi:hypothetical protein
MVEGHDKVDAGFVPQGARRITPSIVSPMHEQTVQVQENYKSIRERAVLSDTGTR